MIKFHYKIVYLYERIFRYLKKQFTTIVYKLLMNNFTLKVGYGSRFYVSNIEIGDNVIIGNNVIFGTEFKTGFIKLGNNVKIDDNCILDCSGGIIIEDDVHISSKVIIYTHDHGDYPYNYPRGKKLIIEKNCWIAQKVSILQNVSIIKQNNIIGYGSIVTKSINIKNSVLAGNPLVYIRKRRENNV